MNKRVSHVLLLSLVSFGLKGPADAKTSISVSISPSSATVQVGQTKQFTATVSRATTRSVVWSVNSIVGGNSTVGTISASGLYTAPGAVPPGGRVIVSAASVADLSRTASASVTIVAPPAPIPALVITTSGLPTGATGVPYSAVLSATGGTAPYTWTVASGQLPAGLTLSSQGVISGTPSTAGVFNVSVQVRDSAAVPQIASASLTIQVADSGGGRTVLWSADFETGDVSQWYSPSSGPWGDYGGGEFNSGVADSFASQAAARSGRWGLEMTITTPPESGTRMVRWREPQNNQKLYYTAWYYFPQRYSVTNYWNVLQWKSKRTTGVIDPFFVLNIGNRSDGSMYFYLYNWQKRQSFQQTIKNVPVGQWFKVEAMYQCAGDGTGRVTFWQDGTLLFDLPNVQTRYSDGDCQWSLDNYSDGVSPSPTKIYIDDVSIASDTGSAPPPPQPAPLLITTSTLPEGTAGTTYSAALSATGGTTPYFWSIIAGSLPAGLSLSSEGAITGTPSASGVFNLSVQVRDSASSPQTATALLAINIAPAPAPVETILWSADFETGDTSQWYYPSKDATGDYGGGEFNSGIADSVASQAVARSGRWSLEMTITTPPESGTRMFRWREPQSNPKLYYRVWYYFPQRYSIANYWNIFQWKSKRTTGAIDPFFVLNVGNRSDGSMYLYLYNWQKRQSYSQSVKNVPVGQWFQVEAMYQCAPDGTGRVTFWQDGTLLFDVPNVQTRYVDGDCQWSVDNYSDGVNPSPSRIYIDDAAIIRK